MTRLLYSDREARSEDGTLVFTARSPHNAADSKRGSFQHDFVYSLSDASGTEIWRRSQGPKEASPITVFVHPSRRALARVRNHGSDALLIFDPTGKVSSFDLLSEPGIRRHARSTTAGYFWDRYAFFRFVEVGGRPHFSITPWWGDRILIDLEAARRVTSAPSLDEEAAFALRLLQAEIDAGGPPMTNDDRCKRDQDELGRLMGAALLVGRQRRSEAAPLLRALEQSPLWGRLSSWFGSDTLGLAEGDVDVSHGYKTFNLRQIAQLSLRRLGLQPAALPAVAFYRYRPLRVGEDSFALMQSLGDCGDEHEDLYVPAGRLASANKPTGESTYRAVAPEVTTTVTGGMSGRQVLDLLGAPDHVGHGCWEYDRADRTLRVTWARGGWWFRRTPHRVTKVEEVIPPVWLTPGERESNLV